MTCFAKGTLGISVDLLVLLYYSRHPFLRNQLLGTTALGFGWFLSSFKELADWILVQFLSNIRN